MAKRTVYFYKVNLFKTKGHSEQDFTDLKGLYDKVFLDNCVKSSLGLDDDDSRATLDILSNDDNYFWGRLGKEKDNNTMHIRDYTTYTTTVVLPPDSLESKATEVFTYFILDYTLGILTMAAGQSAPSHTALNRILSKYNKSFYTEFQEIPNQKAYEQLFRRSSVISQVQYSIPVPSPAALAQLNLGLTRQQLADLMKTSTKTATITIKSDSRRHLTKDLDLIKDIVTGFIASKDKFEKIKITGRNNHISRHEFDLKEELFSNNIDVPYHEIIDKRRVPLDIEVIAHKYFEKMRSLYMDNRERLAIIVDRYKGQEDVS